MEVFVGSETSFPASLRCASTCTAASQAQVGADRTPTPQEDAEVSASPAQDNASKHWAHPQREPGTGQSG